LTATTPVLPDENQERFEELHRRLFEQYQPVTTIEAELT